MIDFQYIHKLQFEIILFQFLRSLNTAFDKKMIRCYWQTEFNLLNGISSSRMQELADELGGIVSTIDDSIKNDSTVIARYICNYLLYF